MARLAGAKAYDSEEMNDPGPRHNDIRAKILKIRFGPFDYGGSQFAEGGKDYGLHLAAHVTYQYDNEDGQTVIFTEPYNCGKIQYVISSNGTEALDARESDIDWPGDPIGPDPDDPSVPFGIDLEAVNEKFAEIYSESKDRNEYSEAIVERYGGIYPFVIGRHDSLMKNKWGFFTDKAKSLMGVDFQGDSSDDVFVGVEGQFVRLPPPERKQSKEAAAGGEKITSNHVLVMLTYFGKDAEEGEVEKPASGKAAKIAAARKVAAEKKSAAATKEQATGDTVEEVLLSGVIGLATTMIAEEGYAEFDLSEPKTNALREYTIGKENSFFSEGRDKPRAWKLVTKDAEEFFGGAVVEGFDLTFEDGTLTIIEG